MINRSNWKLTKEYLKYRFEIDQISRASLELEEDWLRHLLEWAKNRPFDSVERIRPTFQEYLRTARLDGQKKPFSTIYIRKIYSANKRFFKWLITSKKGFKHRIDSNWINSLRTQKYILDFKEHEAVTIDEIRAIANADVYSLRDKRIRAAAVFWFLSGIRIGAFVTLPIKAIDLDNLSVKQWPDLGVKTKFNKREITYMLNIPDLLDVIKDWDQIVRNDLSEDFPWFARFSPDTGLFDRKRNEIGEHRTSRANKDLKEWLDRVGLPYHSPHKFRHGNAVYSFKIAKTPADLKAISQNLMHSNLSITDGIYGILSKEDRQKTITHLGEKN